MQHASSPPADVLAQVATARPTADSKDFVYVISEPSNVLKHLQNAKHACFWPRSYMPGCYQLGLHAFCRDMPILSSPAAAYAALRSAASTDAVEAALREHFGEAGSGLESMQPCDWSPHCPTVAAIEDERTRQLACDVHQLWPLLCRKVGFVTHEKLMA